VFGACVAQLLDFGCAPAGAIVPRQTVTIETGVIVILLLLCVVLLCLMMMVWWWFALLHCRVGSPIVVIQVRV